MINITNYDFVANGVPSGYAIVTFADGTQITLTDDDFTVDGNIISDRASVENIPYGQALEKTAQLSFLNVGGLFNRYNFSGAKIDFYVRYRVGNEYNPIKKGTFTVVGSPTISDAIHITAFDDMIKADIKYESNLTYPTTVQSVFNEVMSITGLRHNVTLENGNYTVKNNPVGYTCREIIGMIAGIEGGNARINIENILEIKKYELSQLDNIYVDAGSIGSDNQDTVDGGDYQFTNTDILDAGSFEFNTATSIIGNNLVDGYNWTVLSIDYENAVTGVVVTTRNNVVTVGNEGYMLYVSNALVDDADASNYANYIYGLFRGIVFNKFSGEHTTLPEVEFGDIIDISYRDNNYKSFVTGVDFDVTGVTRIENTASNDMENNTELPSPESDKKVEQIYDDVQDIVDDVEDLGNEIEDIENDIEDIEGSIGRIEEDLQGISQELEDAQKEVEDAAQKLVDEINDRKESTEEMLKSMFGSYRTETILSDGSSIRYYHDAQTMAASKKVWRFTAGALTMSTDGGITFPYGIGVDGGAIFDYIKSNYIEATDLHVSGNSVFEGIVHAKNGGSIAGFNIEASRLYKTANGKFVVLNTNELEFGDSAQGNAVHLGLYDDEETGYTVPALWADDSLNVYCGGAMDIFADAVYMDGIFSNAAYAINTSYVTSANTNIHVWRIRLSREFQMVFLDAKIARNSAKMSGDTAYTMFTVADADLLPKRITALSYYGQSSASASVTPMAYINQNGSVKIRQPHDASNPSRVYISGAWIIDTRENTDDEES